MPTIRLVVIATTASIAVCAAAGTISDKTERPVMMEVPRFPVRTIPSQRKYWIGSGWSYP